MIGATTGSTPPENGSRDDIAKDVTRNTYITHLNNDRMAKGKVVVVVGVRKRSGSAEEEGESDDLISPDGRFTYQLEINGVVDEG